MPNAFHKKNKASVRRRWAGELWKFVVHLLRNLSEGEDWTSNDQMQAVLLKPKVTYFFMSQEVFHQVDFSLLRMENTVAAAQ